MPGSAIAGLYGDCVFCLFNEIKRLLSGVAVLCMRVQVSLHHHQHLIVSFFILLVLISLWSYVASPLSPGMLGIFACVYSWSVYSH